MLYPSRLNSVIRFLNYSRSDVLGPENLISIIERSRDSYMGISLILQILTTIFFLTI
jgi:hypothetical protein